MFIEIEEEEEGEGESEGEGTIITASRTDSDDPEPVMQAETPHKNFATSFSAQELTWIRLEVDNNPAFEIMLRAGESYRQIACEKLVVRIGNSGGVSIQYNDSPVEINGRQGKPVDLVFPRDALAQ